MKALSYLLFGSMPFLTASIPFFIGGYVYIVEIIVLFYLIKRPLYNTNEKGIGIITPLDIIIILNVVFGLLSVIIGADNLYDSMATYRRIILTPSLIYFAFRTIPLNRDQMVLGMYFLIPGILLQVVFVYINYSITGDRAGGLTEVVASKLTVALLISLGLFIIVQGRNLKKSTLWYMSSMALAGFFFVAMLLTLSRSTAVMTILLLPLAGFIWHSNKFRRFLSVAVYAVIGTMLLLIFATSIISSTDVQQDIEGEREKQHSVERLASIEIYKKDIVNRFLVWGKLTDQAMENPIFGSGAHSRIIGLRGGTNFRLGSAHNFFVSTLITAGVIGLILLLAMIISTYRNLNKAYYNGMRTEIVGAVLLSSYTIMIMGSITNDLSSNRVFLFYFVMGLAARISVSKGQEKHGPPVPDSQRKINNNYLLLKSKRNILR